MSINDIEKYYPKSKAEWRNWLAKNHLKKDAIWLIQHKKASEKPSITWSDAVDEALCFGWIDSVKRKLDQESTIQYFSKRKAKSTWSKINKDKVKKLIAENKMTQAGLDCIEIAKKNGSWTLLDSAEKLIIPKDLETALNANKQAMDNFLNFSKSTRKILLSWIVLAKRQETRAKRIEEIVIAAGKNEKPKQF